MASKLAQDGLFTTANRSASPSASDAGRGEVEDLPGLDRGPAACPRICRRGIRRRPTVIANVARLAVFAPSVTEMPTFAYVPALPFGGCRTDGRSQCRTFAHVGLLMIAYRSVCRSLSPRPAGTCTAWPSVTSFGGTPEICRRLARDDLDAELAAATSCCAVAHRDLDALDAADVAGDRRAVQATGFRVERCPARKPVDVKVSRSPFGSVADGRNS